jgi:hypothetical protein
VFVLTYKLRHCEFDDPKSYVLFVLGIRLVETLIELVVVEYVPSLSICHSADELRAAPAIILPPIVISPPGRLTPNTILAGIETPTSGVLSTVTVIPAAC